MDGTNCSPLSRSLGRENHDKPLPNPFRSLDRSRAGDSSKMRPRIIYRTPTNSISVSDNEGYDNTSGENRRLSRDSDTMEPPAINDNGTANCDRDMDESGSETDQNLVQESTDTTCCLRSCEVHENVTTTQEGKEEDMNNQDHINDSDGSTISDNEESVDLEMPGQASKADKRYLALYCNNYCNEFARDSFSLKVKMKPKNNSGFPVMDNYPCCCPAGQPASPSISSNKPNPKQPHFSAKLTVHGVPLTPAVSRELEQLKPIPVRMSTPVGILWTLLTITVAGTCSFSFMQPFWFTQPQTGNSFGMYSYCIHDTRHIHDMIQTCGIYGGQFRFSNVPSHAWQAACVLYGGGCALLCFSALLAMCSMCAPLMYNKRIVLCSGYMQLMAVLIMVGGLLVFPLGLDTRFFQHYCGRSAGPYNSADCQLGWGYMLGIMGTALSVFCPFLSQYTDVKIHSSSDS